LPEGYEHLIKGGRVQILPLKQTQNLKQDLEVLQTSVQIWPDDKVLDRVKTSMLEQCFLTTVDLGAGEQQTPSGYALEVRSQTSLARAKDGRKNLELALTRLNTNIFKLLELKVKGAKDIIKGNYNTRIIFPDILPKSATDTINQVNSRLLSLDSAMKMTGIENPNKEIEKVKEEITDPILGPELSKNWQAQMTNQAQQVPPQAAAGAGLSQPGQTTPESGAPAQLNNENAAGMGPMPMAMAGVPGGSAMMSSQGTINQNIQAGR
jgi:hypothetical protein